MYKKLIRFLTKKKWEGVGSKQRQEQLINLVKNKKRRQ